ncbi:MAG TPA: hypothetical protein VIN38_06030 [Thiobacillus sp.]
MIKKKWEALNTRVSAMSTRERAFIFVALAVVTLALLQTLVVDALQLRKTTADARLQTAQAALQEIEQQQHQFAGPGMHDPDQIARDQVTALEARLSALNAELEERERSLIPPSRMAQVLKDVVQGSSNVKIVGIKTLSPQPVTVAGAAEGMPPGFYRHGFEITVKGRYSDLVAYLSKLEALPWRLNWVEVSLDTADRPELTLTLTVHTLSLEEAWLRV